MTISSCNCCVFNSDVVSFMIWFNCKLISFLHSLRQSCWECFEEIRAREDWSRKFCSKKICSKEVCSKKICSREMKRFSSREMKRRIYLDFKSKTWLIEKSEKVKKSSKIWLFMMKIIKLSKNLMKMLQNWRFQMCFRFNQSFETRLCLKDITSFIYV
jgi:hypothetical protein